MKCPVCGEKAKKVALKDDDDILVRCSTDGDFLVTPAAGKRMEDVPVATRQLALNRAIRIARRGERPKIKKSMVDEADLRRKSKMRSAA